MALKRLEIGDAGGPQDDVPWITIGRIGSGWRGKRGA
jgi:hypothetical protein